MAISDTLKSIDEKLDKLLLWKGVHEAEHVALSRDVEDLRSDMYGNSDEKKGIKLSVEHIITNYETMRQARAFWEGVAKTVIAAGIVGAAVWFLRLYAAHAECQANRTNETEIEKKESSNEEVDLSINRFGGTDIGLDGGM